MKHLGNVMDINGAEIEPVDIITFGSPCQDLSVAGKREGLEGERSNLFYEAVKIIREMREATNGQQPTFAVWENVPGAFSSNGGFDFRAVIESLIEAEVPMPQSGKWANAGMVRGSGRSVAWRVLDAQYWGVPQRRKRILLVADFAGQRAGEILFEQPRLPRNFETCGEEGQEATTYSATSNRAASERRVTYGQKEIAYTGTLLRDLRQKIGTQTFEEWLRGASLLVQQKKILRFDLYGEDELQLAEKCRIQKWEQGDSPLDCPAWPVCRLWQTGCEGCPPQEFRLEEQRARELSQALQDVSLQVSPGETILSCVRESGESEKVVLDALSSIQERAAITFRDTVGTLRASAGAPKHESDWEQLICQTESRKAREEVAAGVGEGVEGVVYYESGPGWISEGFGCLRAEGENRPSRPTHTVVVGTVSAKWAKGTGGPAGDECQNLVALYENHGQDSRITGPLDIVPTVHRKFGTGGNNTPLVHTYAVRRLTPTECLRLQGFPDYWLDDIPGNSDTAKYKAIGNSLAIPCVLWIMRQIKQITKGENQCT